MITHRYSLTISYLEYAWKHQDSRYIKAWNRSIGVTRSKPRSKKTDKISTLTINNRVDHLAIVLIGTVCGLIIKNRLDSITNSRCYEYRRGSQSVLGFFAAGIPEGHVLSLDESGAGPDPGRWHAETWRKESQTVRQRKKKRGRRNTYRHRFACKYACMERERHSRAVI